MKIIKSLFIFCIIIVSLNSCGSFSEAGKVLRNEKTKSTDEFLIKKKDPLTQPPDFNTIPEPGSVVKKSKNSIEKIIKDHKLNLAILKEKHRLQKILFLIK